MPLALPLSFLFALTAFVAPHSSRELFTEPQGAQTDKWWLLCSYYWYFSRFYSHSRSRFNSSHQKAIQTALEGSIGEPRFWHKRSLENNLQASNFRSLLWRVSHRLLLFFVSNFISSAASRAAPQVWKPFVILLGPVAPILSCCHLVSPCQVFALGSSTPARPDRARLMAWAELKIFERTSSPPSRPEMTHHGRELECREVLWKKG